MNKDTQEDQLTQWEPGMVLPSRKETHGKKKKSRRQIRKQMKPPEDGQDKKGKDSSVLHVTVMDQLTEEEKKALLEMESGFQQSSMAAAGNVAGKHMGEPSLQETGYTRPSWLGFLKRLLVVGVTVSVLLALIFWAKFAYVYRIPAIFADSQTVFRAEGYVIYKSWWFGPPLFNLSSYGDPKTAEELRAFYNQLGDYREVIDSPKHVVWRYYGGSK